MRNESKNYIISLILLFFPMTAGFFILEYFNGGNHPLADMELFIGFLASEIITFSFLIYFTLKARKNNFNHSVEPKQANPQPIAKRFLFDLLVFVPSLALSVGIAIAGYNVFKDVTEYKAYLLAAYIFCAVVPIVIFIINAVLEKKFLATINNRPIEEIQNMLLRQRNLAEEAAIKNLKILKKIRIISYVYTVLCLMFGILIAFLTLAVLPATMYGVSGIYAFILFTVPVSRILFRLPKYPALRLSKDKYPQLYELAYKAAKTLNVSGQIVIALSSDYNAAISKIGRKYFIVLGVSILNIFTEEELYSVLLHEFGHFDSKIPGSGAEDKFYARLEWQAELDSYANFISGIYGYMYMKYANIYALYCYASSIFAETEADKAMVKYGDAKAAASSLTKLNYYDLYSWEKGTYDEPSLYESENVDMLYLTREIDQFRVAIEKNSEKWNKLLNVEILARNASHPTLKMRLETLGIDEIGIVEYNVTDSFKNECRAALTEAEEYIYRERRVSYREEREAFYIAPKQIVEKWEEAGCPVTVDNCGEIFNALSYLGRHVEAYRLCENAINTLPPKACAGAYLMKGSFLLRSYDEKGIEFIYKAIELDHEFLYALDLIGVFCCKTGRQKELDEYRAKSLRELKDMQEIYSKIDVLEKGDNLTEEKLPQEAFDSIMSFIQSYENNSVESVYFLRKTIKADYFVICVVVKFKFQTKLEDIKGLMDNLYIHLEGMEDQKYVLFDYMNVSNVNFNCYEGARYYLDEYKG